MRRRFLAVEAPSERVASLKPWPASNTANRMRDSSYGQPRVRAARRVGDHCRHAGLLAQESVDVRTAEAVALSCPQVKKWIGAFSAAQGEVHTFVCAGGIGEHAPLVRERICARLSFLDIELDAPRNPEAAGVISTDASRATVRVIRTGEELMIARSVLRVGHQQGSRGWKS